MQSYEIRERITNSDLEHIYSEQCQDGQETIRSVSVSPDLRRARDETTPTSLVTAQVLTARRSLRRSSPAPRRERSTYTDIKNHQRAPPVAVPIRTAAHHNGDATQRCQATRRRHEKTHSKAEAARRSSRCRCHLQHRTPLTMMPMQPTYMARRAAQPRSRCRRI